MSVITIFSEPSNYLIHDQYRQLTPEQRYQLQALYNKGFPQYQIAESL
ncbi:helix-turn-helix domain-containing protein, partial [Xenorhabdus bovienii]|nr:helix-turn-helix domain-containing protein [Xenorhabdus bovienii]